MIAGDGRFGANRSVGYDVLAGLGTNAYDDGGSDWEVGYHHMYNGSSGRGSIGRVGSVL